jgi:hypothetical protein
MMAVFGRRNNQNPDDPRGMGTRGGPVYDARIDNTHADRLALAHELHLQGGVAPAQAFSHYRSGIPNETAVALMGLAQQRDLIQAQVDRVWDRPYPGVKMSPSPSVHRAPSTNPVLRADGPGAGAQHLTHHAHFVESKKATRVRLGFH